MISKRLEISQNSTTRYQWSFGNFMAKLPQHLGIILDGNRRWAQEQGLPVFEGHRKGLQKLKETIKWCKVRGIKTLSLFVFSTENWQRPKREVDFLMALSKSAIRDSLEELQEASIKIKIIGQKEKLSKKLQKAVTELEQKTQNNEGMLLNFALSYGGRTEIVEAVKKLVEKQLPAEEITEKLISDNLWASDLDLIIRTGKEQRLSNFLIWQAAYSELYFLPKYWPDFSEADLDAALADYTSRHRRFGR